MTLPSQYVIGIMVFSLIMFSGIWMISAFIAQDNSVMDTQEFSAWNSTFNKIDSSTFMASELKSKVTNATTDVGTFGILNGLIDTAWQALRNLFTTVSFMDKVLEGVASLFEIPKVIVLSIIGILGVMMVFAIWGAVFQKEV